MSYEKLCFKLDMTTDFITAYNNQYSFMSYKHIEHIEQYEECYHRCCLNTD